MTPNKAPAATIRLCGIVNREIGRYLCTDHIFFKHKTRKEKTGDRWESGIGSGVRGEGS